MILCTRVFPSHLQWLLSLITIDKTLISGQLSHIITNRKMIRREESCPFPTMFSRGFYCFSSMQKKKKNWIVLKRVNPLPHSHIQLFTTLYKKPIENIFGKGENAGNQYFLFFPKVFSTLPKTNLNFFSHIYFVVCV